MLCKVCKICRIHKLTKDEFSTYNHYCDGCRSLWKDFIANSNNKYKWVIEYSKNRLYYWSWLRGTLFIYNPEKL